MQTTQPNLKRLVFVTGDKGGVGKSFTARALLQYYLDHQHSVHAFDIDPVNPNLEQFYSDQTTALDIDKPGALDEIRNQVENQSLILVDCAARALTELDHWFQDLGLLQEREELHLAFTFVFVITPDKSCTAIMAEALEKFGHESNYLIVKNYGKGSDFSIYEKSKVRQTLLQDYHGKEISLRVLLEKTVVRLDQHDVAFGLARSHPQLDVAGRSRVKGFLLNTYAQFNTVKSFLLPNL